MAENKKSFILYCDVDEIIKDLPNEVKGQLFQLIVDYVNDRNPQPTDLLLKTAFAPIKAQLKRDLLKWDEIRAKRSEAGKASADKRQHKSTHVESVEQKPTNSTVTDNVTVTVNDSVINNTGYIRPKDFLENHNSMEFEQLKLKSRLLDINECIEQWSLSIEGSDFKYSNSPHEDYRKLKAKLEKWVNSWRANNNKTGTAFNQTTNQEPPKYKKL